MRRRFVFILSALVLVFAFMADAKRTSHTVKNEKQATAQKIQRTRRQLDENLARTRAELGNLQTIEGEMRRTSAQAARLRAQVNELNIRSRQINDSISIAEKRLEALKTSYAKALRAIRRTRHTGSDLSFIFAASSFAEGQSRARYLRELARWEAEKAENISVQGAQLRRRHAELDSLNGILRMNLDSVAVAEQLLREQKHRSDAVVGSLKRQSKNLNKVLKEQEELARKLDNELSRLIAAEQKASEVSKNKKDNKTGSVAGVPGASFEASKGKLPSPVDRDAIVVAEFGRHNHDIYSKVEMQNNGIDFETSAGAHARAVYPGVVSMIIVMEGYNNVVLVRHGEYLTVYAGLSSLDVRKGQEVKAGQTLGTIAADTSGSGKPRLHFEVRHEKEKLNPSSWLSR